MRKILVVQDNPKYQENLINVLQKFPDTKILTATDGITAFNIIKEENPEILISDTQLKDGSVDLLVKEFKKKRDENQAILVKGKDQFKTSQMGLEDNLDKVLQNPYHPEPLIYSIKCSLNYLSLVDVALASDDVSSEKLN